MDSVVSFIKLKLFATRHLWIKAHKGADGISCNKTPGRQYVLIVLRVIYTCSEYNRYERSNKNINFEICLF